MNEIVIIRRFLNTRADLEEIGLTLEMREDRFVVKNASNPILQDNCDLISFPNVNEARAWVTGLFQGAAYKTLGLFDQQ